MKKGKDNNENLMIDLEKVNIERNLVECEQYDKSIKVIILGDSYVGKSSLINRLINNKFVELSSTLSIEYHTYIISINDFKLRMQIWDTAGQEKYNSIISNYYKGTDVAIFVYSIDKEESFQNVEMWFKNLKENNNSSLNILIGNKKDLEKEEGGRIVKEEKAEKFAEDNGFFYFSEISCKNKEQYEIDRIYDVFDEIGKHFYEKSKDEKMFESVNYNVSESMRSLGEKHRIKKDNANKKKKCC